MVGYMTADTSKLLRWRGNMSTAGSPGPLLGYLNHFWSLHGLFRS